MSIKEQHSSAGGTDVDVIHLEHVHPHNQQPNTSNPYSSIADGTGASAIEALCLTPSASPAKSESEVDVESLCLPQDFRTMIDVEQVVTTVPLCKPEKEWFFRVLPGFTRYVAVISEKKDN